MNSKPRQAPPGGVSAVAHTLTANDAATLTLSVAEQPGIEPRVRMAYDGTASLLHGAREDAKGCAS
jgi:hypothetical protein